MPEPNGYIKGSNGELIEIVDAAARKTLDGIPECFKTKISGKVGQIFEITAVDTEGNVTGVQAVDKPAGGGNDSGQNPDGGLSTELKTALTAYFTHVMPQFDDTNGLAYINAILTALGAETRGESGDSDSGDSGEGGGEGGSGEDIGGTDTVTYTISNELVNVTSDNSASSVTEGASYTATLTATDGYELDSVDVTMGGVDVTVDVYADGVISISAVTGNVEIVASASAVKEAALVTEGLLGYWDMRNMTEPVEQDWHWAYPSNEGDGGLYASAIGGSMGTQTLPVSDEYGSTASFKIMRDAGTYPADVEFGTEFTFIILSYGNPACSSSRGANGVINSNIPPNWKFNAVYYNTGGTSVNVQDLGCGNGDSISGYNFLVKRVSGEDLRIILNTSECCLSGANFDDFGYWWQVVDPISYNGSHNVAFAIYDRALTDAEIEDMKEYFKTLEVA